jgi:endonuclease G
MMFDLESLTGAGFSWQRALSLAVASKLAYESESIVDNVVKNSWGFSACRFIDVNETQGFIAHTDHVVLVSFRGTESLGDWLGNLRLNGTDRPYGVVHSGFLGAYLVAQGHISAALGSAGAQGKRLWVTGHSLGGALAAVFAAEELNRFNLSGIYTYGQPRTGRGDFAQLFATNYADSFFRFVNDDDMVPRIPPGYAHVGNLIHFDSDGNVRRAATEAEATDVEAPELSEPEFFELQRQIKRVQQSVVQAGGASDSELVDASVEGLFPSISDHAMERYIAAIRRFAVNTAQGAALSVETSARLQTAARRHGLEMAEAADEATRGFETDATADEPSIPVLLRLNGSEWQAPEGLQVNSQFGRIVSAIVTPDQLRLLENDESVAGIEVSREGGQYELAVSVPFVGGDVVHRPPLSEKGINALVGLIDSGIDVLHEAFRDAQGNSRIVAIWNQRDPTGPSPHAVDPAFSQDYGTVYTRAQIQDFIQGIPLPSTSLRDPFGHGTHVASIAAGRAVGNLADGIAPESLLVAVIPNMKTEPGQPPSIGYSLSHFDALHFLKTVAAGGNALLLEGRPIAVNVSLGMNAGAHDGSSTLEASFDSISNEGRDPGFVIVKSAGNERGFSGHARKRVIQGGSIDVEWMSTDTFRFQDYLEVWYSSLDTLRFELVDPAGNRSETISTTNPLLSKSLGGNLCQLKLTDLHTDNGDSCLAITILSQTAPLQAGVWKLQVEGVSVGSNGGFVDLWLERDDNRPTKFMNGEDTMTLSIPGTANTVVTVSACEAASPLRLVDSSSMGRTRDNRPKPDLCAPGREIAAARSNQSDTQAVVRMTGTSMAAPHVTGAVALALSRRFVEMQQQAGLRQFNARQIQAALIRSTKNFSSVHHEGAGFGMLDISRFLATV